MRDQEREAAVDVVEAPPPSPIEAELAAIRTALPEAILSVTEQPELDTFWIDVRADRIVPVAQLLRDTPELDYAMLSDLFGVDYPSRPLRFEVVYNLYSLSRHRRLFLRVPVGEGESVPTLCGLYAAANWCEREVFDLFGVHFEDHPDLRRILLPDDWDGHPLRKDYPLIGRRPVILFNDVKDIM